jgi:hypothetical protein
MRNFLSISAIAVLAGCGVPQDASVAGGEVVALPSPAGVGSGEPFVSSAGDAVYLSWIEAAPEAGHDVWMAKLGPEGWSPRSHVIHGTDFFVNWADFPSLVAAPDGSLWAHWLQREEGTGLAYGIRIAYSTDDGRTWSEPWTPHEDGTPTEHGFVSLFPMDEGIGLVWLDGRKYARTEGGGPPSNEMTVRFRRVSDQGPGPEVLLDGRACDCCQTDVAVAAEGPVAVYRDRSEAEVRDIYVSRWSEDGWTEGVPVHEDGWVIEGCPVNGPAVAARGASVAVAWFTAPDDAPRVTVALSPDGGVTFGDPVRVDGGNPAGRVDALMRADGSVVVTWLERTGGEGAEVRLRVVAPDGTLSQTRRVTSSTAARASGFPRMTLVPWAPESVLVAWTNVSGDDGSGVEVATVEVPRP